MRVISSSINNSTGDLDVKLQITQSNDVYEVYNLIALGDVITATAVRNVIHESSTGTTEKTRTKMTVTMEIERIEFDYEQLSLRVLGRNIGENKHIKIGQYQSVDIEEGSTFTIKKENGSYDDRTKAQIAEMKSPEPKEYVIVLTMQFGLANVCLVSSETTLTVAHIERTIPKKKELVNGRDKAIQDFFRDIYSALKNQLIKVKYLSTVAIGSPGFLNADFLTYCIEVATKTQELDMLKFCKTKVITCHTSSGYKSAVNEIFQNPDLRTKVEGMRAYDQVNGLSIFYDTLRDDEDRACYGLREVFYANQLRAIKTLLITDTVYNVKDAHSRQEIHALIDQASQTGEILKFSNRHFSGQELDNYTGIAAILHFPVPNLADLAAAKDDSIKTTSKIDPSKALSKEEIEIQAFTKSLVEGSTAIKEEYDEFDEWDELDQ